MDTTMGVKGLIFKDDQVLVLFKPDRKLDLPGGRVECGETHEEALLREIREETGLSVRIQDASFEWCFVKGDGRLITGITYCCNWLESEVRLSPEHFSYYWANPGFINHPELSRWLDPHSLPAHSFMPSLAKEPFQLQTI